VKHYFTIQCYLLCCSKSGPEARVSRLESVLDKATSLIQHHHSQQLITSILHDAESHNWSDDKEYFEVCLCVSVDLLLNLKQRMRSHPIRQGCANCGPWATCGPRA